MHAILQHRQRLQVLLHRASQTAMLRPALQGCATEMDQNRGKLDQIEFGCAQLIIAGI